MFEDYDKFKKKEFILFLESVSGLLDLPQEKSIQSLSLQLNTFRKMYHDFCVKMLASFLTHSSCTVLEWPVDLSLQPDLYVMTKNSSLFICEVTLSLSKNIIDEKKKKYLTLDIEQIVLSPLEFSDNLTFDLDISHFLDFFENICNDFFFKINSFKETLLETNINISDINVFNEIFEYKPTRSKINWPSCNIANDEKKFLLNVENVDLLVENIKSLMEDKEVSDFLDLKYTKDVSFSSLQGNILKKIENDFEGTDKIKLTYLFYPGNVKEQVLFNEDNDFEFDDFPEQKLLFQQLKHMTEDYEDFPMRDLLQNFKESLFSDKEARQVFSSGTISEELSEPELREEYRKSKSYRKISFLDFQRDRELSNTFGRKEGVVKVKTFRVNLSKVTQLTKDFLKKSKTSMSLEDYTKTKMEKMKKILNSEVRKTSLKVLEKDYTRFVSWKQSKMAKSDKLSMPYVCKQFLYKVGKDNDFFKKLKMSHRETFEYFLNYISKFIFFQESNNTRMLQEQLLHLQGFDLPDNCFSIYNSGITDIMYIIRHSSLDKGKDVGKAFCFFKIGNLTEIDKKVYGFCHTVKSKTETKTGMHMSRWRRLPSERVVFHIDQYYSVLSTTYNTMLRGLKDDIWAETRHTEKVLIKSANTYLTRYLISQSHSQQFAEMLADYRYLYMHSVSDYSSVKEFCLDKYVKPINNFMECELILSIHKFDNLRKQFNEGGVLKQMSEFIGDTRNTDKTGGVINLPGILDNRRMKNIQDFLDEMFLYVHTNKEPSSQFHEYVKSFQTIEKYQKAYEELLDDERRGDFLDFNSLKSLVIRKSGIGHNSLATQLGAVMLSDTLRGANLSNKIEMSLEKMTLLDINSTKAVIPELERKRSSEKVSDVLSAFYSYKKNNNKKAKRTKNWSRVTLSGKYVSLLSKTSNYSTRVELSNFKFNNEVATDEDKLVTCGKTGRCKVHDSTLHLHKKFKFERLVDLAFWNIQENDSRVLADVCIKSQYGAKREFYVVNHGAKAMVKVVEVMFETISKVVQEEMISVSGDNKMFNIQNLIDKATKDISNKKDYSTFYCNGDCTKWSAAETMECFDSFLSGFNDKILTDNQMNYCKTVFFKWKNKRIEIPKLLKKNIFFKKEEGDILFDGQCENQGFKSEQNFLQGMFNYFSSLKAVSCTMFTENMWRKLYPNDVIYLSHMEHSDDYAFVCLAKTEKTFFKFKRLHRICMRLFGINDSLKKTNCQRFLLEFISLVNFNGVMVYPEIKKVKEVGLNIGCLGYPSDISNTNSRVGEAARIGVSMESCYIMSRIQNVRIAQAYGLFGKNSNIFEVNFENDASDVPIELWGVPDMYPIFYMVLKGECNNYRLWKYSDTSAKISISLLYILSLYRNSNSDDTEETCDTFSTSLYHPDYMYVKETKLLESIKKQSLYTYEESLTYFKEHPMDVYLKPRSPSRFIEWLSSKYYQRGFGEAYMKQSRTKLQLRISHFSGQNCLKGSFSDKIPDYLVSFKEKVKEPLSISEYVSAVFEVCMSDNLIDIVTDKRCSEENELFNLALQNFDIGCELIYKEYNDCFFEFGDIRQRQPRSYKMPVKPALIPFHNNVTELLQREFTPKDFFEDERTFKKINKVTEDMSNLNRLYNSLRKIYNHEYSLKYICELDAAQKFKNKPCTLYKNPKNNFNKLVKYVLKHNTCKNFDLKMNRQIDPVFKDVHSVELDLTEKGPIIRRITQKKDLFFNVLGDIGLWYSFFRVIYDDEENVDDYMGKIMVKNMNVPITLEEFLKAASDFYINGGELSEPDTKVLSIMCLLYTQDTRPINRYLETHLNFSFKYIKKGNSTEYTEVEFEYLGERFLGKFLELDKSKRQRTLRLYFQTPKLQLLTGAFVVLKRLAGLLSVSKMLDLHTSSTISDFPSVDEDETEQSQLWGSRLTNSYTFSPNKRTDRPLPCFKVMNLSFKSYNLEKMSLHRDYKYNFETLTVMSGEAKLFNLPFLSLKQTNEMYFDNDFSIRNVFLSTKFFLKDKRLENAIKGYYKTKGKDMLNYVQKKRVSLKYTKKSFMDEFGLSVTKNHYDDVSNVKTDSEGRTEERDIAKALKLSKEDMELMEKGEFDYFSENKLPEGQLKVNLEFEELMEKMENKSKKISENKTTEGDEGKLELNEVLMDDDTDDKVETYKSVLMGNLTDINMPGPFCLTKSSDRVKGTPFTLNLLKENLENLFEKFCISYLSSFGEYHQVDYGGLFKYICTLLDEKYTVLYDSNVKFYINTLIKVLKGVKSKYKGLYKINDKTIALNNKNGVPVFHRFVAKETMTKQRLKILEDHGSKYFFGNIDGKDICIVPMSTEKHFELFITEDLYSDSVTIPEKISEIFRKVRKQEEEFDQAFGF